MAWANGHVLARIVAAQIDVCGLYSELAALRHGVARVDCQIDNDLLKLSRIRFDAAERVIQHSQKVYVFAYETAQHLVYVCDHAIEVNDLWLKHLLAAEGQKLARQGGCAVARTLNLDHVTANQIVLRKTTHYQIGVACNSCQQIIEVMSHAAR